MSSVNPTGKIVYVRDEVLQDPASGKFSFLGIFDDVVAPPGLGYPFRLGRMCVAAQLVGGSGSLPIHVEVVEGATQNLIRRAGPFTVAFPSRHQIVTVCVRLLNVDFPAPGGYFVELYSQGVFLDDRILRLHLRECFAMSDHLSYQANPETRGTATVQLFENDRGALPPGTKSTPRPADRPRELPPGDLSSPSMQLFQCEEPSGAQGATATPRPGRQESARE